MIGLETLLAFLAAAFVVISIPGPTILLVMGYAVSSGLRIALLSIAGVCLGDLAAMAVTFAGLGAVLAASSELFLIVKWVGAVYLVYLGVQLWRAPAAAKRPEVEREQQAGRVIRRAFTVNVLHPKGLAFYAAFLPQFISPTAPALPQMLVLSLAFAAVAVCVLTAYALAAARLRLLLLRPRTQRMVNRSGAGCLIGAGLYTATLQRGA